MLNICYAFAFVGNYGIICLAMVGVSNLINFPDPVNHEYSDWVQIGDFYYGARDILVFGGEVIPENLRTAYANGIFPWHIDGFPLPWFCPEKRAILEFDKIHIGRSLEKARKISKFTYTIDKAFERVIRACSLAKRPNNEGTWITDEFIEGYTEFHRQGDAHSVEVWNGEELVGGLYGVDAGGIFCGESMFHTATNASKFALLFLVDHLKARGATWLDIQVMTPHLTALGAFEIPRAEFIKRLKAEQKRNLTIFQLKSSEID